MSRHRVDVDPHHYYDLEDEACDRGFKTASGMLWYILCERYQNSKQETLYAKPPTKKDL